MSATTFPRSQHWNVDGFRVTVLLYKTHRGPCATCGDRPARHAVWTGEDREGFSGGPADFCDRHRPAKGSLPPLDYNRVVLGSPTRTVWEHSEVLPVPCGECGGLATFRCETRCAGCDDPARRYSTSRVRVREGVSYEDLPEFRHLPHPVGEQFRCRAHSGSLLEPS